MFSLRTKLTIALLVTGLVAASVVGLVAQWELWQRFSTAVMRESFEAFKSDVAAYFTAYGSWENGEASEPFDQFVKRRQARGGARRGGSPRGRPLVPPPPRGGPISIPPLPPDSVEPPPPPPTMLNGRERPPFRFLLLDTAGRVLLPNPPHQRGDIAPANLREIGMPINAGGSVIAIAVPLDTPNLSELDDAYLSAMRQALWFGIAVASVIAVALGLLFGTTLSRALRRLTAALHAVAAGDLRQRVDASSRDEAGTLAETFNRMSADLVKSSERVREQALQLERQNEELKEAVKLREEVDRIARHDIKTPLNTVIAVPRLLREELRLRPEEDDLLGIVERAGYRILNMVNLSLDLYKIEQGTYRVRPQLLDVKRLLDTVMADVAAHAAAKRVTIHIAHSHRADGEAVRVHAWAEELLCYSLLANLLKNAVEASTEGGIVTITMGEDDGVVLDIHNEGAVPAEIRERFFEKYATAGKSGGTGLGTYSARLMARVQGGDITMRSSGEEGTTVSVRLPAAPAAVLASHAETQAGAEHIETASLAELPALRVLLVDDDEYNRLVISRYLPAPVRVDVAVNGRDAIKAAAAHRPDVILMDVEMPGVNGLDAAQKVRKQERALGRQPCVIIALSSHDDEETRRHSEEAGCDLYLTKPVTRTRVHSALREVARTGRVSRQSADEASAIPVTPPASQDVVEIDPDLKETLLAFLHTRRAALDEIAQALDSGDMIQLRRLSHRLAGSLGLYGFRWASDQARRLEGEAQNGDRVVMAKLLTALRRHLETVEIRCGSDVLTFKSIASAQV